MGARGPKPQSVKLRLLRGNSSNRPIKGDAPQPSAALPDPPAFLDTIARAEWDRLATELNQKGLLTFVDGTAFAAYCQSFSHWVQANKIVREEGQLVASPRGGKRAHPMIGASLKFAAMMHKFLSEFGLTPASRSRLSIDQKPADAVSSIHDFLRGDTGDDADTEDSDTGEPEVG